MRYCLLEVAVSFWIWFFVPRLPVSVNKEILYLLISFGCAVDAQDRFGETALHVACDVSAQNVQMLLDAGGRVNIQDNAGIVLQLVQHIL